MLTKRIVVRMDDTLRDEIKENANRDLCVQYGYLLKKGLDCEEELDVQEYIEENKLYNLPQKHLKVRLERQTYSDVKKFSKRHYLRRPTAYNILLKKGLEEMKD